jgi:hypothetical protein
MPILLGSVSSAPFYSVTKLYVADLNPGRVTAPVFHRRRVYGFLVSYREQILNQVGFFLLASYVTGLVTGFVLSSNFASFSALSAS